MDASPKSCTVDRNGSKVRVGSIVRVLTIPDDVFHDLSKGEIAELKSMIGESFSVEEIDQWGCAIVTKWWDLGDGNHNAHDLALSPEEMEVVSQGQSNV